MLKSFFRAVSPQTRRLFPQTNVSRTFGVCFSTVSPAGSTVTFLCWFHNGWCGNEPVGPGGCMSFNLNYIISKPGVSLVVPGYSVGSLFSSGGSQLYVAGAPRFNHTGKVIVFTLKNSGNLTVLQALLGEQVTAAHVETRMSCAHGNSSWSRYWWLS